MIRYWLAGDPQAGTVVCTHGASLDHGAFSSQVPALRAAGYRVISWDLRGHGVNQSPAGSFNVRNAADDLHAVMDDARVQSAVLVGQSFGGFVTQEFCRHAPERVTSLVLIGTPPLTRRPPRLYLTLQRTRPLVLRLWPEVHLRRMLPPFMSTRPEVQRYVAKATQALSKAALLAVTEAALDALSYCDDTETLRVPTLFVHGDREDPVVVRMIATWVTSDAMARREVIRDAGHLANQDSPAAFNDILLTFMRTPRQP